MQKVNMKLLQFSGSVSLSGSKSIIQRVMMIAAIQPMNIILYPASRCDDVQELMAAMDRVCGSVRYVGDYIHIVTENKKLPAVLKKQVEFSGSATAFRFWLAYCALKFDECEIEVSSQLASRPHKPLFEALKQLGIELSFYTTERRLIRGRKQAQIEYKLFQPQTSYAKVRRIKLIKKRKPKKSLAIDSSLSSQFTSALMLTGSYWDAGLKLLIEGETVSREYVNLTGKLMSEFGNNPKQTPKSIQLGSTQRFKPKHQYIIEPDMSTAAFFLCLGAFSAAGIAIECKAKTRWQPDWAILDILRKMGVIITEKASLITAQAGVLTGIDVDMRDNPDLVPVLSILALFAQTQTTLRNITHLKYKESDRIKGIVAALDQISAHYTWEEGNLTVFPYQQIPAPVTLNTCKDHRLVMAFSLLQMSFPQIELSETASITKSCPEFMELLHSLKRSTTGKR